MKKLLLVAICIFALAGAAYALPVTFTSDLAFCSVSIPSTAPGYSYTHDLTLVGFVPSTDILTSAALDINLWGGVFRSVNVRLDGNNTGTYWIYDDDLGDLAVDVAWLQTDGKLDVTLRRSGPGILGAYLTESELTANGNRAPVPEPASMMLLGMGILGLVGLKRKA